MLSALSRPPYGYVLAACAPGEQTMNYNALSKQRERENVRYDESLEPMKNFEYLSASDRNMTEFRREGEFTKPGIHDADAHE